MEELVSHGQSVATETLHRCFWSVDIAAFRMVEHVVHECSAGGARSWWEAR